MCCMCAAVSCRPYIHPYGIYVYVYYVCVWCVLDFTEKCNPQCIFTIAYGILSLANVPLQICPSKIKLTFGYMYSVIYISIIIQILICLKNQFFSVVLLCLFKFRWNFSVYVHTNTNIIFLCFLMPPQSGCFRISLCKDRLSFASLEPFGNLRVRS